MADSDNFTRGGTVGSGVNLPGLAAADFATPWNLFMYATAAWYCFNSVTGEPTAYNMWGGISNTGGGGTNSGIWHCRMGTKVPINPGFAGTPGGTPVDWPCFFINAYSNTATGDFYSVAWNQGGIRLEVDFNVSTGGPITFALRNTFQFFVLMICPRDQMGPSGVTGFEGQTLASEGNPGATG